MKTLAAVMVLLTVAACSSQSEAEQEPTNVNIYRLDRDKRLVYEVRERHEKATEDNSDAQILFGAMTYCTGIESDAPIEEVTTTMIREGLTPTAVPIVIDVADEWYCDS